MGWKEVAAGLDTRTTVGAIEAAKGQVSKRQYKRLIATAVAQLLELHPDIGRQKARKRAWRLTGAKPSKKLMREAALAAAAPADESFGTEARPTVEVDATGHATGVEDPAQHQFDIAR